MDWIGYYPTHQNNQTRDSLTFSPTKSFLSLVFTLKIVRTVLSPPISTWISIAVDDTITICGLLGTYIAIRRFQRPASSGGDRSRGPDEIFRDR